MRMENQKFRQNSRDAIVRIISELSEADAEVSELEFDWLYLVLLLTVIMGTKENALRDCYFDAVFHSAVRAERSMNLEEKDRTIWKFIEYTQEDDHDETGIQKS